ncbi:MAG: transposase, partial [Alphaproteobacteria bacterium]
DGALVTAGPLLALEPDWQAFLAAGLPEEDLQTLRAGERTGRPLGSDAFIKDLETRAGRSLAPRRRGPKPRSQTQPTQLWGHYF